MRGWALGATVLMLTACGGSPTAGQTDDGDAGNDPSDTETVELESSFDDTFADVEGLTGQERRDALAEIAEDEGDLNLYTSHNSDIAADLISAFEEDTGLGVSLYRAGSETVRNRILEEARADVAAADVVETNGPELVTLAGEDVLQPFESPVHDDLTDDAQQDGWTATRFNIFTVAWNTSLVSEDERPTDYTDLADPVWDGRLTMELGDYDWYWSLWHHLQDDLGMSADEADAYFNDLADGAAFTSGHTTMRQLLIAGEYAVAASDYSYGIAEAATAGAPVEWRNPVEPLFARPNGVGMVRNAPNPASALVFAEWMLSDGQEVLLDNSMDPTREDLLVSSDDDVRVIDVEAYLADEADFISKYEDLARRGERVEE